MWSQEKQNSHNQNSETPCYHLQRQVRRTKSREKPENVKKPGEKLWYLEQNLRNEVTMKAKDENSIGDKLIKNGYNQVR